MSHPSSFFVIFGRYATGWGFEGRLGLRMIEKGCHVCGELDEDL